MTVRVLIGDCREELQRLPPKSVHCVVTSPPYWSLRDYGHEKQLGLEETPEAYVKEMVRIFRQVRRVLRDDGTVWLNIGDKYLGGFTGTSGGPSSTVTGGNHTAMSRVKKIRGKTHLRVRGLKEKDLVGIPWRVAFALQADGWWLRSEIIWHKPAPMPENVPDRPTRSHEQVFLLAKSASYYYDADAIRTEVADKTRSTYGTIRRTKGGAGKNRLAPHAVGLSQRLPKRAPKTDAQGNVLGANRRTVWTIGTARYEGEHYSVYPAELVEPCILAGCPVGGTVLDPFAGSGTTGEVAVKLRRDAILIELNPKHEQLIHKRCSGVQVTMPEVYAS